MLRTASYGLAALLACAASLAAAGCQDVSITSSTGVLKLSPTTLDFGSIASGTASTETVFLDNISPDVSLEVLSVVIQGADSGSFSIDEGNWSGNIEKSSSVPLNITFSPTEVGYHTADFVVTTEGADESEVTGTITLRGEAVGAVLLVYPLVLDFGPLDAGDSSDADVTVENPTAIPIVIDGVDLDGDGFSYEAPGFLGALPWVVDPGDRFALEVTFEAASTEAAEGALTLAGATFDAVAVALLANTCEGSAHPGWDHDGDGFQTCAGDCDDSDADVSPAATEVYDGGDNDCDGTADEGTVGFDDDGDGQSELDGDCNDGDGSTYSGAEEAADGRDNDCDGDVDEGTLNDDGDDDGYTGFGGDCEDANPIVHPGMAEDGGTGTGIGDGIDNDCDGYVDEGTRSFDDDGDGWCEGPTCVGGSSPGDCNDGDVEVHPGAAEVPDGKDNDCNGTVDDGSDAVDDDADGYADAGGDCDDGDPDVYPGAVEVADGVDQDCDGLIDEGTASYDDDGDGSTEAAGDCNDGDPTIHPGAEEDGGAGDGVGDGRDNDCDGTIDERTLSYDDDEDGVTEIGGDCNDFNPYQSPAAIEIAGNFIDDDCDGETDEYGF